MGRAVSTVTCHAFPGPPWRKGFYLFYLWNTARSHCVCKRGRSRRLKVDPQGRVSWGCMEFLKEPLKHREPDFITNHPSPPDALTYAMLLWARRGRSGDSCSLDWITSCLENHLSGSHPSEPSDCLPAALHSSAEPNYAEKSWSRSKKCKLECVSRAPAINASSNSLLRLPRSASQHVIFLSRLLNVPTGLKLHQHCVPERTQLLGCFVSFVPSHVQASQEIQGGVQLQMHSALPWATLSAERGEDPASGAWYCQNLPIGATEDEHFVCIVWPVLSHDKLASPVSAELVASKVRTCHLPSWELREPEKPESKPVERGLWL